MLSALVAALARGRMVLGLAATRTALFTAVRLFVHGRPRTSLGFLVRNAAVFVSLLDMLRLSLLLICVAAFISSWHYEITSLFVRIKRPFSRPWSGSAVLTEPV